MRLNRSTTTKISDKPRLVIFDLDGTAIQSDIHAHMSTALEASIREATESGLKISIATGRSWGHFTPAIDNIHDSLALCIISGGSQIVDVANSLIIWEIPLSRTQIDALNVVANKHRKALSYNNRLDTYGPATKIQNMDHTTIAYLLDIKPVELVNVHSEVAALDGLHVAITHTWGDTGLFALHITSNSANKGSALLKLTEIMGVDSSDVIAIGDGLNDVPMFEVAGISYAIVGSVVDNHRLTAGSIPPVTDDGLAKFLKRLYYKYKENL